MTNREMLETMSNDELAEFLLKNEDACRTCVTNYDLGDCANNNCVLGIRYWLESEVEK